MAGLIGNPIGYKRLLTSSDDLNNVADGIYWMLNTNNPANTPDAYNNVLIQFSNLARGDKFQFLFDGNYANILFRRKDTTSWSTWKKITLQ